MLEFIYIKKLLNISLVWILLHGGTMISSIHSVEKGDLTFTLYTSKTGDVGVELANGKGKALKRGKFNLKNRVVFIAPGWVTRPTIPWALDMKDAYLGEEDVNLFIIDWRICSESDYFSAVKCVTRSGESLARFIRFLMRKGVFLSDIHLIGHSLGAHLMGSVADNGLKVRRITGLDPAGPLFAFTKKRSRLDKTDADFVDVMHTNIGRLGSRRRLGHLDFYVDGGEIQTPCENRVFEMACSHNYAPKYYTETLKNNKEYPALKCQTVSDATEGTNCQTSEVYMGPLAENGEPGIYFVPISSESSSGRFYWSIDL